MKKRLLTFILLVLGVMSIDARVRLLTNDFEDKIQDMPEKQKKDAYARREQKNRDSNAQRHNEKKQTEKDKKEADKKKQERKAKIKAEREKARQEKVKPKTPKQPKLTKQASQTAADAAHAKAKMHAAQAESIEKNIKDLKNKKKHHQKAQRDRSHKATDEVKQDVLLKLRLAETKDQRNAAAQDSCELHHTCDSATVQDIDDALLNLRSDLTHAHAGHAQAKSDAWRHSKDAGTFEKHSNTLKREHAAAQVSGVKPTTGDHRFSNAQKDIADHRMSMRPPKSAKVNGYGDVSAYTLQQKVNQTQNAIDRAKQRHTKKFAELQKKYQHKPALRVASADVKF